MGRILPSFNDQLYYWACMLSLWFLIGDLYPEMEHYMLCYESRVPEQTQGPYDQLVSHFVHFVGCFYTYGVFTTSSGEYLRVKV